jgi:cytochrome c oxidase subunit IV
VSRSESEKKVSHEPHSKTSRQPDLLAVGPGQTAHTVESHAVHGPTVNVYWVIFGCLSVLTVLTVAVSRIEFDPVSAVVLAFMIAISKATLVVAFFMHVKYDARILRLLCLVPTLLTMLLLIALLPDVAGHPVQPLAQDQAVTHFETVD